MKVYKFIVFFKLVNMGNRHYQIYSIFLGNSRQSSVPPHSRIGHSGHKDPERNEQAKFARRGDFHAAKPASGPGHGLPEW